MTEGQATLEQQQQRSLALVKLCTHWWLVDAYNIGLCKRCGGLQKFRPAEFSMTIKGHMGATSYAEWAERITVAAQLASEQKLYYRRY